MASFSGDGDPAIDVMVESPQWQCVPHAADIVRRAVALAAGTGVARRPRSGEIAVLLCDDAAIAALNARWRHIDRPTNVLSFPAPAPKPRGRQRQDRGAGRPCESALQPLLGDIAIAYETTAREAKAQGKPIADHLAHLAIHGFLHLLGYDHDNDSEAEAMEGLERDLLARMGVANPYAGEAGT